MRGVRLNPAYTGPMVLEMLLMTPVQAVTLSIRSLYP